MANKQVVIKKFYRAGFLDAFKCDCQTLINTFACVENGSYKDFVHIWVTTNFSLLFSIHRSFENIKCFVQLSLEVAKDFLLAEKVTYPRIGALYLLYTIFDRQFPKFEQNIELNSREMKQLADIVVNLFKEGHTEAMFILQHFLEENAFEYVLDESDKEEIDKEEIDKMVDENEVTEEQSLDLDDFFVNHLQKMIEKYNKASQDISSEQSEFQLVSSKTFDQIISFLTAKSLKLPTFEISNEPAEGNCTDPSTQVATQLKRKAMEYKGQPKYLKSVVFPDTQDQTFDNTNIKIVTKRKRFSRLTMLEDELPTTSAEENTSGAAYLHIEQNKVEFREGLEKIDIEEYKL